VTPEMMHMVRNKKSNPLSKGTTYNGEENPVVELINAQDVQYYGPATVGSNNQVFNMVYDTGSSWFWVPETDCTGCPTEDNRFNPLTSTTYQGTGERKQLSYGKGFAAGEIGSDQIGLEQTDSATMKFINVDTASDLNGTLADGIAGLTPVSTDGADLMVTQLSKSKIIDAEEFTVFIGKEGVDKSYIEFGRNADDQENVTYIDLKPISGTSQLIYWSVDFDSFQLGNRSVPLAIKSTIWDTGTSLIAFEPNELLTFAQTAADGRQLFSVQNFYAVE
jgi:cathepsin D